MTQGIDIEAVRIEEMSWNPTPQLRWRRPKRGTDNDLVLEQLWERITGERRWQPVSTVLDD